MLKSKKLQNIPIKTEKGNSDDFLFSQPDSFSNSDSDFFRGEGQLSCDVYQDEDNIIVKSTMAGVDPKNLDISVSNDLLTIRGFREEDTVVEKNNFYSQEIYWGSFSRSIILPQEVDQNNVEAELKNGVLTVRLPKKYKSTSIKVKQLDE